MEPSKEHIDFMEFITSIEKPKVVNEDPSPRADKYDDFVFDADDLIAEDEKIQNEKIYDQATTWDVEYECPLDNEGVGCECTDLIEYNSDEEEPEPISPCMIDLTSEFTNNEAYKTVEEAKEWIKSEGRRRGVVISIRKSDYSKVSPVIEFMCERGGKMRDHVKGGVYTKSSGMGRSGPRSTSTRKCECPFKIRCKMNRDTKLWHFTVVDGSHNHRLAREGLGHARNARLSEEEKEIVWTMSKNGVKPKNILKYLRERNPECLALSKTIYNVRSEFRAKEMSGRSIIQEVFRLADQNNTFIRHTRDGDVIQNVFWAQSDSQILLNLFPSVLIIDCTYKTNRYKMPLLHIVGVTSTHKSFSAAFALLSSEKEETFLWAMQMLREALEKSKIMPKVMVTDREIALMNAIAKVFPDTKQLLCKWHISKNVTANIRANVPHEKLKPLLQIWNEIQYALSEEQIESLLSKVREVSEIVASYMQAWVSDYKEMFISKWVDDYYHLGNTCTSRVEGVHSVLKNWLGTANLNMLTHWERSVSMIEDQTRNIKASFETSLFLFPRAYVDVAWCKLLLGNVSIRALDLMKVEMSRMEYVKEDPVLCRCVLRKTHGLPCAHEMSLIFKKRSNIRLDEIDVHWKTLSFEGRPTDVPNLLDPRPLISQFLAKFEISSQEGRLEMLERLREVIEPKTTVLKEPPTTMKPKGRPKGAINKPKGKAKTLSQTEKSQNDEESTKRDLSGWEHVEVAVSQNENSQKAKKKVKAKIEDACKLKVKMMADGSQARVCHRLIRYIPENWHCFVKEVYDVVGDGHCGYRSVAMGLGEGEDYWPTIRADLWKELTAKKELFKRLMIDHSRPDKLLQNLLWDSKKKECTREDWMVTPDILWVVAECYNVGVTLFIPRLSYTCFPATKAPPSVSPLHIWLINIENSHFAWVDMAENCPVPFISNPWQKVRNAEAKKWEDLYKSRLEAGEKLTKESNWEVYKARLDKIYNNEAL